MATATSAPPANIGKYRIERELGRGASGIVYLGLDGFRGRKVAIKQTHAHLLKVPEQAERLLEMLERRGVGQWASFRDLVADCGEPIQIVGRFLALLELYRARAVAFDQSEPLGVLQVSWTGDRPMNDELVRSEWEEEQS